MQALTRKQIENLDEIFGRGKESQALKAILLPRSTHYFFNSISDSGMRLPKVYVFLFYNFFEAI